MLALAQWLSQTRASLALQDLVWLVPLVQTVHILAIAMVLSAVLMIELRVLRLATAQPMIDTAQRFVPWIWSGLVLLAASGATLIIAEPQRALPNPAFQIKMALLVLAVTITIAFQTSLRRHAALWDERTRGWRLIAVLAVATFALWCAIAFAGRWIAYIKANAIFARKILMDTVDSHMDAIDWMLTSGKPVDLAAAVEHADTFSASVPTGDQSVAGGWEGRARSRPRYLCRARAVGEFC